VTAVIPHQMQLWEKNLNRTQSAQLVKGSLLCRRQDARSVSGSFRSSMAARDRVFCLMEALGLCTTEAQVPSRAPIMYWIGVFTISAALYLRNKQSAPGDKSTASSAL
jgi:hypothetical protein